MWTSCWHHYEQRSPGRKIHPLRTLNVCLWSIQQWYQNSWSTKATSAALLSAYLKLCFHQPPHPPLWQANFSTLINCALLVFSSIFLLFNVLLLHPNWKYMARQCSLEKLNCAHFRSPLQRPQHTVQPVLLCAHPEMCWSSYVHSAWKSGCFFSNREREAFFRSVIS